MHYLHSINIVHRDIKPGNILVDKVNGMDILKITDFNISKMDLKISDETTLGKGTSPAYKAPEVIKGAQPTLKVDVWAAGIILYELCYLSHPFEA
jgi:serine/threonine protein kinase